MSSYQKIDEKTVSEGNKLLQEAEAKLAKKSGGGIMSSLFGSFFDSSSSGTEEAADLFNQAGNRFKLAKSWKSAGDAFTKSAETYASLSDNKYDAASKYTDAGKAYKNVNNEAAINAYEKAVEMYTSISRFSQSARYMKEVAEIYESEGQEDKAAQAFARAADFYEGEDSKTQANSCRVKVAELGALAGKYKDAIEIYEKVAASSLDNKLLKFGAREHLLRAGLCVLCLGDLVAAERAYDRYCKMDDTFEESREGKLLNNVIKSVVDGDSDTYTDAVYDYDSITKLDPWKTTILLRVKTQLKAEEEDLT